MNKFSKPFMAKSPLRQEGEIKSMNDLMKDVPGWNPRIGKVVQGGSVSAPMGSKAGAKVLSGAMAAASALTAPVVASGVIPDVLDKWDTFVEEKAKPAYQAFKDKITGGKKKSSGSSGPKRA